MADYKRNVASNRDALFGAASASPSVKSGKSPSTSRPQPTGRPTPHQPKPAQTASSPDDYESSFSPGPSKLFGGKVTTKSSPLSTLTGQAKLDKMAQAQEFRLHAKKAMTRGVFSRPDPIAAGNYYKRAADAYKQCGENRLERLHRIASGDCQLGQDAFATAAAEYTRAAELAEVSEETLERKRLECHKLHLDAAGAWAQMGERGRAAESTIKAAFGLGMGEDTSKPIHGKALESIEAAIETFVPDPLNRKSNYRRTGKSIYEDPNVPDPNVARSEAIELAHQNIVSDAFAHETLFQVGAVLIQRHHLESALYAHGAGTASLESEGIATVSLARAYLSETVLTLALGDVVAASRDFQQVHLQRTSYLTSRECALAEDLIRACTAMDLEALDEARSKTGPHRSAMANLEPALRRLVLEIRVSGRAKKGGREGKIKLGSGGVRGAAAVGAPVVAPVSNSVVSELSGDDLRQSLDAGFAEMDDIMNVMGLNNDGDDDDEFDLK